VGHYTVLSPNYETLSGFSSLYPLVRFSTIATVTGKRDSFYGVDVHLHSGGSWFDPFTADLLEDEDPDDH
jgi:hypothetical protein